MPLFVKQPNADTVLIELIKRIDPSVKPAEVVDELNIHPDYPHLLALNDVLNNFGIQSSAYRIQQDELQNVPCPFIAHTNRKGTEYVLVNSYNKQQVNVSHQQNKNQTIGTDEFLKMTDGVVLVPDIDTVHTAKKSAAFNVEGMRYPLAMLLLFFVLAGVLILNPLLFSVPQMALAALFKTVGVAVSVLLLVQSIDRNNPLVQTLCGGEGKANCNAILSSRAAKVFTWLSWSEVGFFYFTGTWLALLWGGADVLEILAILSILSLPYTIYSIYYQARIAKQWCVLCCTVQALLWLEFVPMAYFLKTPVLFPSVSGWLSLLTCFALPVALWMIFKPVFLKAQQVAPLKRQLHKFKYNIELFNTMLKDQPKYALPDKEWSIVLGNADANNVITMVSDPYCQPCSVAHKALEDWLHHNADIQARIVFTANNTDDDETRVVRHLMALNALGDKSVVENAVNEWYGQKQKDYKQWAGKYPIAITEEVFAILDKQNAWCQLAEITGTPTVLVNGYQLPDLYQLKDIKYMLE